MRSAMRLYSGPVFGSESQACWAQLLESPALPKLEIIEAKLRDYAVVAEFTVP